MRLLLKHYLALLLTYLKPQKGRLPTLLETSEEMKLLWREDI